MVETIGIARHSYWFAATFQKLSTMDIRCCPFGKRFAKKGVSHTRIRRFADMHESYYQHDQAGQKGGQANDAALFSSAPTIEQNHVHICSGLCLSVLLSFN
jgi:aminoglycoside phosphotransferase